MELESIIKLIQTVSESSLTSFTLEEGNMRISLTRGGTPEVTEEGRQVAVPEADAGKASRGPMAGTDGEDRSREAERGAEEEGQWEASSLVRTFYAAASPEEEPYVRVGDAVKKGQILGIVEAMKLMNEIESEHDGIVREIRVENGQMVEYGQPMFLIG